MKLHRGYSLGITCVTAGIALSLAAGLFQQATCQSEDRVPKSAESSVQSAEEPATPAVFSRQLPAVGSGTRTIRQIHFRPVGANALIGEPLSREKLLELAIDIEGHPDNVVPSLLGGLCMTAKEIGRAHV